MELDSKVSEDRLGKRYNEIRLLVEKIKAEPNTVFIRVPPEGGRSRWSDREKPAGMCMMSKALYGEMLDFFMSRKIISEEENIFSGAEQYGGVVILQQTHYLTMWDGCIEQLKKSGDPEKVFDFVLNMSVPENSPYDVLYEKYQQICSKVCVKCSKRFECSSHFMESHELLGVSQGSTVGFRGIWGRPSDEPPITQCISKNVFNLFMDYFLRPITILQDQSVNLMISMDSLPKVMNSVIANGSKFYRHLDNNEKENLLNHLSPSNTQAAITRTINDYRKKEVCPKCLFESEPGCNMEMSYSYGRSSKGVRCSYMPLTLKECSTIITESRKQLGALNEFHHEAVHMFKMLRVIDREVHSTFDHKFPGGRRKVGAAVIDYSMELDNFGIRAKGNLGLTDTMEAKQFLKEVAEVTDDALTRYEEQAESFELLHLYYWMYSNHYSKCNLRKVHDRCVNGFGWDCSPVKFGIEASGSKHVYDFYFRWLAKYDQISGSGVHNTVPILNFQREINQDCDTNYDFVKLMEFEMSQTKSLLDLKKKYENLRGSEIRHAKVYKTK